MSVLKKHLYSILNAKTSRRYALQEDEEEALLSTFREISCQVHEEAGKPVPSCKPAEPLLSSIRPVESLEPLILTDIKLTEPLLTADKLNGLLYTDFELGEPFLVDYEPVFGSPFMKVSRTAQYVSYFNRLIVSVRGLIKSIRDMLPTRESTLQEEEERALFGTMEDISREVRREAAESGVFVEDGRVRFVAAYEKADATDSWTDIQEPEERPARGITPAIKDALSEMVLWRKTQKMARQPWAIIDMYDEYMDEELTLFRRIMDRNGIVKRAYVKAHPVAT